MADETYYAWSRIEYGKPSGDVNAAGLQPMETGVKKVGEVVTASDLGATDEDFQELVNGGAVRAQPFPELPENWQGSPIDYMRAAVRVMEESLVGLTGVNESLLRTTMTGPLPEPEEEVTEEVTPTQTFQL